METQERSLKRRKLTPETWMQGTSENEDTRIWREGLFLKDLPHDVLPQILLRLPVFDLKEICSISKWMHNLCTSQIWFAVLSDFLNENELLEIKHAGLFEYSQTTRGVTEEEFLIFKFQQRYQIKKNELVNDILQHLGYTLPVLSPLTKEIKIRLSNKPMGFLPVILIQGVDNLQWWEDQKENIQSDEIPYARHPHGRPTYTEPSLLKFLIGKRKFDVKNYFSLKKSLEPVITFRILILIVLADPNQEDEDLFVDLYNVYTKNEDIILLFDSGIRHEKLNFKTYIENVLPSGIKDLNDINLSLQLGQINGSVFGQTVSLELGFELWINDKVFDPFVGMRIEDIEFRFKREFFDIEKRLKAYYLYTAHQSEVNNNNFAVKITGLNDSDFIALWNPQKKQFISRKLCIDQKS